VGLVGEQPMLIAVNPHLNIDSLVEMVATQRRIPVLSPDALLAR
jgi:hypothetical protein